MFIYVIDKATVSMILWAQKNGRQEDDNSGS